MASLANYIKSKFFAQPVLKTRSQLQTGDIFIGDFSDDGQPIMYVAKQTKQVSHGFSYGETYNVMVCKKVKLVEVDEQDIEVLRGFGGEFGSGSEMPVIGELVKNE